ncbi:MAG TPA: hypothetical protein HA276_05245 [Candidatus Poseidoniaceae archaeon]|nr:MAG: hypothetical protein CBD01_000430 [Euryarchaeota archaeon TMED141]DAC10144.1 MAG TPA: hypothetical protein D7I09_04315 [Candidatus Poseidoniales archaeon]DAC16706.1 MAG TPA: hypothetical protein D7I01_05150 [Candidatus Poseidoniales archaeon]HII18546.1 hypothetical protein [Candidatus Poseidoniaceae archaeon]HII97078.1 hypothetical protein [Candidatus Poseidoniaceae archaeon]|tara:strand:+ start:1728 stop:2738 length:1011 start_codon:yes stop_codon:yes gene_type:complete
MEGRPTHFAPHVLGLINPGLVIAGNLVGGPAAAMGAVWMLGVGPVLDRVLGARPRSQARPTSGRPYQALLYVHTALHVSAILTLVWLGTSGEEALWLAAAAVSTGICSGVSGIIVAHELGHTRPKSLSAKLARLNMLLVLYGHFTEEHNVTHHKHVATAADPASARAEESVWGFVARTVPKQLGDAYALHAKRGARGWRNRVVRVAVFEVAMVTGVFLLGASAGWAFLGQAAVAVFLLEYINYVQHYGLRRGKEERQSKMHSWQSERRWSCWTLFNLSLHPAHHLKASEGWWDLQPYEGAPDMPSGYYGCFWPALLSPLWKRWMAAKLADLPAAAN